MRIKDKTGFTLIEIMVAVSIFSIIALVVSTVFITIAHSYQKARDLQILADNINSAMDIMTYDLSRSSNFDCFTGIRAEKGVNSIKFYGENYTLYRQIGSGGPTQLTSDKIKIEELSCKLFKWSSGRSYLQIRLRGDVVSSLGDSFDFNLQTGVSQRLD